ncbi:MAG: hypothetical protein ACM3PY_05070 [Omnitrophica WOR_2 bacterium]
MDIDPVSLKISQPSLFDFIDNTTGAIELFPAVWSAAEDLNAPEVTARRSGLERLVAIGAPRLSPLIAYLLATRLQDPDLDLRIQVVKTIGELYLPDEQGRMVPDRVLRQLNWYLSQMHTRAVFGLLQVANDCQAMEAHVARILNACPYGGNHLAGILADRKAPMPVRKQAANMIGTVGFLDAVPVLERLVIRLEARVNGQQTMVFAPPPVPDEAELLPAVMKSLEMLRTA